MKASSVVCVLSSFAWIGCGAGNAANDGGGGAGGGAGGIGGTISNDAGADRACGAPAQTYTFATQRIATLASDRRALAITLRADGTPLFYYWGGPMFQQQEIWALGPPEGDDAGVSVSVGYQLTRGPSNAGITYSPVVRATRTGAVRIAYSPSVSQTLRYIEWSGDFNEQPVDTAIDSRPNPYLLGFDLDPQDRPGVVYRLSTSVLLATNSGSGWQSETAWSVVGGQDTEALGRLKVALAFDGSGAPVVFPMPVSNDLYVATKGSQWTSTFLDPKSSFGFAASVGRDGLGQIEVMFLGALNARRAVGVPGAWDVNASVPTNGVPPNRTPDVMALGSAGEIHAVYAPDPLIYAYYDGCTWSTQSIAGESGGVVGIALDAAGRPHIAYGKSGTAGELWYAHPAP